MKVFITGGTGFIGTHLALRYRGEGHEVMVLAKEATPVEAENARELEAAGVRVLLGSVTDDDLVAEGLRGADLVHHIAAAMREANVPDTVFWETNVEATRRMLERARSEGVGRFVYCSSIGVMGKTPPKGADESFTAEGEDIYQVTKKAAEQLCLEFQQAHGFPLSAVRPADVYGPRDRRLLKLFRGVRSGKFAMIGSGRNEHHMVYIDDLVDGMVLAGEVEEAVGQVFILAGEEAVSLNRLTAILAEVLEVKPPRLRVPLAPVRVAAWMVEKLCRPFGIQPPIYPRRVDFFRSDYAFDISRAKQVLGYRPRHDMTSGIRKTMEWYQQRGLL